MAGSLSNYAEDAILKWLTGNATQPTSTTGGITAALLIGTSANALVTETGTTATGTPASGTATITSTTLGGTVASGFSTQSLTAANWGITASGDSLVATYNADLTFVNNNASTTVTVGGVGLYVGGATSGNLLAYTDFLATKQLAPAETLIIPSGTLKLQLT